MKKALVTGRGGFIGTHMFQNLKLLGWEVTGIDLKGGEDIRDFQFSEKYDVIFHMAAKASIPASFEQPSESLSHNVYGALRVLEHAKKFDIPVIFSSSSSVYGEPVSIPTSESTPLNYVSPYALTKYEVEQYMKLLGVRGVALRYFNVFGPGQEKANAGDNSLLLAIFLHQKQNGQPLSIVGDGEQKRDFVFVEDVVEANLKAFEWIEKGNTFGIFNVGTGKNHSVNEIANTIDLYGERIYLPARPEPRIGLADNTALRAIGWEPKVDVLDWLETQS